jgi:hypothetical protein
MKRSENEGWRDGPALTNNRKAAIDGGLHFSEELRSFDYLLAVALRAASTRSGSSLCRVVEMV